MLWYKAWLETRWRFLIGLALLMLSAGGTVVFGLSAGGEAAAAGADAGRSAASSAGGSPKSAELARTTAATSGRSGSGRTCAQTWTLFAVLLGTGGLLSQASGGGALFTLSLPVSRDRLLGVRAATALAELLVLALRPVAADPAAVAGRRRRATASATRSSTACACSSPAPCSSAWRSCCPPCSATSGGRCDRAVRGESVSLVRQVVGGLSRDSLFGVMSAETYFRGGGLPWLGLLVSAAVSAAMLYAAAETRAPGFLTQSEPITRSETMSDQHDAIRVEGKRGAGDCGQCGDGQAQSARSDRPGVTGTRAENRGLAW